VKILSIGEPLRVRKTNLIEAGNHMVKNPSVLKQTQQTIENLEEEYAGHVPMINYEFRKKAPLLKSGDFNPSYDSHLKKMNALSLSFDFTQTGGWKGKPEKILSKLASKYNLEMSYNDDFYILKDKSKKKICEILSCTVWIDPVIPYADRLLSELAYDAFGAKE
jgi:hypothetical protein